MSCYNVLHIFLCLENLSYLVWLFSRTNFAYIGNKTKRKKKRIPKKRLQPMRKLSNSNIQWVGLHTLLKIQSTFTKSEINAFAFFELISVVRFSIPIRIRYTEHICLLFSSFSLFSSSLCGFLWFKFRLHSFFLFISEGVWQTSGI